MTSSHLYPIPTTLSPVLNHLIQIHILYHSSYCKRVNVFNFADQIFIVITQLCNCSVKAAMDNTQMDMTVFYEKQFYRHWYWNFYIIFMWQKYSFYFLIIKRWKKQKMYKNGQWIRGGLCVLFLTPSLDNYMAYDLTFLL